MCIQNYTNTRISGYLSTTEVLFTFQVTAQMYIHVNHQDTYIHTICVSIQMVSFIKYCNADIELTWESILYNYNIMPLPLRT